MAQDNDYGTWKAYRNRYWPALYLIDPRGRIVYQHFGEGRYDETERSIRRGNPHAGASASHRSACAAMSWHF